MAEGGVVLRVLKAADIGKSMAEIANVQEFWLRCLRASDSAASGSKPARTAEAAVTHLLLFGAMVAEGAT